jgi:hypothetical protein
LQQNVGFSARLEDKEFFCNLQKYMTSSAPKDLCSIYLTCRENYPNMLNQVVEWMTSKMNKETSAEWLAALEEHGIANRKVWETLGS